jgi:hypothetical protein
MTRFFDALKAGATAVAGEFGPGEYEAAGRAVPGPTSADSSATRAAARRARTSCRSAKRRGAADT